MRSYSYLVLNVELLNRFLLNEINNSIYGMSTRYNSEFDNKYDFFKVFFQRKF